MKINPNELLRLGKPKVFLTDVDKIIIKIIKKYPGCTQNKILLESEKDRRHVQRRLDILVRRGIISRKIGKKGNTNSYKYISN